MEHQPEAKLFVNKWVLAVAASCCAGMTSSYVQSAHFFIEPMREIYDITYKEAAIIPTMGLVFMYLTFVAYLAAYILNFRRAMLLAAVCCAGSQAAAAFATDFPTVVMLLGFVNGFGTCLGYNFQLMYVAQVFPHEVRNRALVVVHFGSGVFMTIYPLVIGKLMENHTLQETLLLMSGFSLHLIPLALLVPACRPHVIEPKPTNEKAVHTSFHKVLWQKLDDIFEWELLATAPLLSLCFASYLFVIGSALVHSFSTSILTKGGGFSNDVSSAIISACGVALLVGKACAIPFTSERLRHWKVFALSGLLQGVMTLFTGLMSFVGVAISTAALLGIHIMLGLNFTIHSFIIIDMYPVEKFSLVFSYTVVAMMTACLTTPVISGWLVDLTQSFEIPLRIFGTLKITMFLIPVSYIVYLFIRKRKKTRSYGIPLLEVQ